MGHCVVGCAHSLPSPCVGYCGRVRASVGRALVVCVSCMLCATDTVGKQVENFLKNLLGFLVEKSSSLVEAGLGGGGCLLRYSYVSFACGRGTDVLVVCGYRLSLQTVMIVMIVMLVVTAIFVVAC